MSKEYAAAVKRIQDAQFQIRKFEDYPQFCRAPIYIAGDRQIHIMQPFDRKKNEAGGEPVTIDDWVAMIPEHGQIVLSFKALDAFIKALLDFREARTGVR